MQRLIQNLLEVSRIETGHALFNPKWESLLRLLAKVYDKYNDYIEDNGLTFDIEAAVPAGLEISADPQKVWNVFDNIIYNTVRYTQNGGITITASTEGAFAKVTVTDTGCGIGAEHMPHVFKRFYKASPARDAGDGESGLGLYIVKNVMEGCGGFVEIESEAGKGARVCLTFPARSGAE
ncbi:MAG: HAMP domain-containing histidine kinase [Clostridiales bacterium]|nr:HAMP domain-containing histidine kinase [Clostridiales bacterium]